MRGCLALVVAVGCGRVDFDPLDDAGIDSLQFEVGCADGEREGLVDDLFAAACSATWTDVIDLRHARLGTPCGDDLGACAQAADACAAGWHLCADSGLLAEIERIGTTQCSNAGAGAWVSASSHCGTNTTSPTCPYLTPTERYACYPDNFCSEPICCGQGCQRDQACKDAVFPAATMIAGDINYGCGALSASAQTTVTGFLCCRD